VFVTVQDTDLNTDPGSAQTVGVKLTDATSGDSETLTLTETGLNTGIFRTPPRCRPRSCPVDLAPPTTKPCR